MPVLRDRRRAAGVCTECGGPIEPDRAQKGRRTCVRCAERNTARYARMKAERRCVTCGTQDDNTLAGRINCLECAQKKAKGQAARMSRAQSEHRCARCGRAMPGDYWYVYCEDCKKRVSERRARKITLRA